MAALVVGGAGFVGSHVVAALLDQGERVIVVDDLSNGHRDAVPAEVAFVEAGMADSVQIARVCREHGVDAALHFAGRIEVGESVKDPRSHWRNNVAGAVALMEGLLDAGVRHLVFSSTAAVYGAPDVVPIEEGAPEVPTNPYGATKLAIERMLGAYADAYPFSYTALRYFNAAGADHARGLGERHDPETHLIPHVARAALGLRGPIEVFGKDYPTPDGTCIRDYVHVSDLADAHVLALAAIRRGNHRRALNLGSGVGHSVEEVIRAVERVSTRPVPRTYGPRRAGDPPRLVASSAAAREHLGWNPTRSSLERIVADALAWHSRELR